jgi:uncharacterized protein
MLYQVGPLVFDTFPFSLDSVDRQDAEDYAKHDLLNARRSYEHEGPGDDCLTLAGEFLPFHIGGLSDLEFARSLKASGEPQFVMRGDGYVLGWFVIVAVGEKHAEKIAPTGVAYTVKHEIKLENCGEAGEAAGSGLIASLLSLFG